MLQGTHKARYVVGFLHPFYAIDSKERILELVEEAEHKQEDECKNPGIGMALPRKHQRSHWMVRWPIPDKNVRNAEPPMRDTRRRRIYPTGQIAAGFFPIRKTRSNGRICRDLGPSDLTRQGVAATHAEAFTFSLSLFR
jgi:hypothetical protein